MVDRSSFAGDDRLAGVIGEIKELRRGLDHAQGRAYTLAMLQRLAITLWLAAATPSAAQSGGAAVIEQVPTPRTAHRVGVQAIDRTRSSATSQNPAADRAPPLVSAETLAVCQRAQATDRPAPQGIDCVRALQVAVSPDTPSAESSLLPLFGQNATVTAPAAADNGGSVSAEQVSRQLTSGDFQGTIGSDAAASVARDRPPPQTAPPPR